MLHQNDKDAEVLATYAGFEPVRRKGHGRFASSTPLPTVRYRPRPPKLSEADEDGQVSAASLNAEFDSFHPENEANPRRVAKPVGDPHRPGPHGGETRLPAGAASVGDGGDGRCPAAGPPPSGADPRASR